MSRNVVVAALFALLAPLASFAGDKDAVRIGVPRSIFRDVPAPLLVVANQPFKDLIKTQTGLAGEVVNDPEAMNIAREMDAGRIQLGVFLGHEFAWAQQKYPDIEAIVCSVPKPRELQAFILVRHNFKADNLGDLKGNKLVLATGTRDHARLFLDKKQADDMVGGAFCSTAKATSMQDAFEKVIEGDADVTVADQASWKYYQKLYPGRSQNLRVLAESEVFPPTVIAYHKGGLTAAQIAKVREGLLAAHKTNKCAILMGIIKVDRFDVLPTTYGDALKATLKLYPAPPTDWVIDK